MSIPKVLVDQSLNATIRELLAGKVQMIPWGSSDPEVAGIYTFGHPVIDGAVMDQYPNLKVISNCGVGVDHINLADAAARNIPVGNTPGVLSKATADMAWALLLAAGRRLAEGDRLACGPDFTNYDPDLMLGIDVHEKTIGILGMGRIGFEIARRAAGFDMPVIYHNRNERPEQAAKVNATFVTVRELLQQSDYLVLICPLTDETSGLIGKNEFQLMKPTAVLINVARGPVVNTDDLIEALEKKEIYAAGLDVTDPEPLPRDNPLLAMPNVVITPHLGSATVETRRKIAELSVENLLLGLAGKSLKAQISF